MKKRVLVLNCGTLAATDINMALRFNEEFEIWGASISKNHGIYVYKNYIEDIPNINDENFIEILNKKIKMYDFKFIIPTHEDIALFLQKNKEKINAIIVCSEYETALLCRYKSKTYEKLKKYDFVPKTYLKDNVLEYPVFIKKDNDQGARHAYIVKNKQELELYTKEKDMIICEYLPGEEVTVDCFSNKNGDLLFCNPRAADRMLAGIDVHARRIKLTKEIQYIGESINKEIKFRGFWFFQIKKDINGKFKLLEISTRLPGAFSLSRCMDVNLPLLALKDFNEENVDITYNDVEIEADKQFFGKYSLNMKYDEVYIDFKTCFEQNKIIDTLLIMFIYQCINNNKKIFLIGKAKSEIIKYINNNKISENIFNNIIESENIVEILLKKDKSIYISNNIDIKNLLRKDGYKYCFSSNIIEALIDWRA